MAFTYTIIIPHYNLPGLLDRCLKSIPVRNDIQVIVVDDLSNEESRKKLTEMQSFFPSVQFIFCEKNGGGGAARNRGLAMAQGEYVLFADADDYFCKGFESILDKHLSQNNDITFFNAHFIDAQTGEPAKQPNHVEKIIRTYKKNPKKGETLLRFYFGEPWCKAIRRDIIVKNNIQFDETKIHNDTKFSYLVGFYAKSIAVCDEPIYNYTVRQGSVSKIISDDRLTARVNVFAQKNRFLQEHCVDFFDKLMVWPFKYCKEKGKYEIYKQCLDIAAQYGYDESFINKLLRQNKFETFFPRVKKKILKMLGIRV
jgi:glycosyltransferase involved in cell wall biosynthesis